MTLQNLSEAAKAVFLGGDIQNVADLGWVTLSVALAASLACSLIWSWAYSTFYGARSTGSNIHRCFPLIGIAVTAIFICVQFSLPLSLGLLGSLSIVRFRTPIKEPEEIGFIMLVIASSLCCASFNGMFLIALLAAGGLALVLLRLSPGFLVRRGGTGTLVVKCRAEADRPARYHGLSELMGAYLDRPVFDSLTTHGDETVMTWSFRGITPEGCGDLERSVREAIPEASVGIFFHGQANA